MKTSLFIIISTITAIFVPVELMIMLLMFMIGLDTLVKLISLKRIAIRTNRMFKDVFSSQMLRHGYIYKSAGYLFLSLAVLPLDYFVLSPYLQKLVSLSSFIMIPHNSAVCTNVLLIIFCIMEVSSINENWFDISGNNLLKGAFSIVKKLRHALKEIMSFKKELIDSNKEE